MQQSQGHQQQQQQLFPGPSPIQISSRETQFHHQSVSSAPQPSTSAPESSGMLWESPSSHQTRPSSGWMYSQSSSLGRPTSWNYCEPVATDDMAGVRYQSTDFPPVLTKEQKRVRRKEQNRLAQQDLRRRRVQHTQHLENKVEELARTVDQKNSEIRMLEDMIRKLQSHGSTSGSLLSAPLTPAQATTSHERHSWGSSNHLGNKDLVKGESPPAEMHSIRTSPGGGSKDMLDMTTTTSSISHNHQPPPRGSLNSTPSAHETYRGGGGGGGGGGFHAHRADSLPHGGDMTAGFPPPRGGGRGMYSTTPQTPKGVLPIAIWSGGPSSSATSGTADLSSSSSGSSLTQHHLSGQPRITTAHPQTTSQYNDTDRHQGQEFDHARQASSSTTTTTTTTALPYPGNYDHYQTDKPTTSPEIHPSQSTAARHYHSHGGHHHHPPPNPHEQPPPLPPPHTHIQGFHQPPPPPPASHERSTSRDLRPPHRSNHPYT